MQIRFHNRQTTLIVLAIGGLIGLGKDLAGGVASLYVYAQTPKGLATVVVASCFLSGASLLISALRR
jgi:hypothetical protein